MLCHPTTFTATNHTQIIYNKRHHVIGADGDDAFSKNKIETINKQHPTQKRTTHKYMTNVYCSKQQQWAIFGRDGL